MAAVGVAIGAAFAPIPAPSVERWYSSLAYPMLQDHLTRVSNRVPFALVDALLAVVGAWLVWALARAAIRARAGGRVRALMWLLAHVATVSAVLYLAFLAAWGLNYRRIPLAAKVRFDSSAVSPEGALALARTTVDRLNALYEGAHTGAFDAGGAGNIDASLARAFVDAQRALGVTTRARPGRPKGTILDLYFRAAGVEGMTDPFFLETLVASDLLPFERPLVVAHEWGHLAGFADEGEANFVGWLTCTRASEPAQYSGWLFLYTHVVAGVKDTERADLLRRLDPGPRADLRAALERTRRNIRPLVADAGWRVYDRYLKANRVEAGRESYADVVRLVLGIRLDPT